MTPLNVQDMALVAAILVLGGYVLLGAIAILPAKRAVGLELLRVFFSATLIICVLIVLFLLGPAALIPAMAFGALRIGFESASVRMTSGPAPLLIGLLSTGLTVGAMLDGRIALMFLAAWLLLTVRLTLRFRAARDTSAKALMDLLVFPILPLAILAHGAVQTPLAGLILATYILVEIFDSLALVSGKLFGRTKAFPNLSPNKTVEGLAGGALCLIGLSVVIAVQIDQPLWLACGVASLVGLLAIAGDLAASRIKRIGGVKDFPIVLSRQGGLLDSLDSWIAAGAGLTAVAMLAQLC
ncbi:MAG: phosphatidate cytidylyltransferase [Shimia sp.]|uniref:phosphatidate cytidylyltransferase n=1 Tax=Shimia sp. TaxID=1954381 RepID=UPI00405A139F